jgi:xanthine dehydrogenase accessory factor
MRARPLRDIFDKIQELLQKQEAFAVATIVGYKGSVPRRLAKMIVTKAGGTYGTIGGGCVEGQVAERALIMLREGAKGALVETYDLVEEDHGGVGMNCGGKVDVAIEILESDPQLVIAGSGHLAKAIAKLGAMLGFDLIVIDPMARKEDFPEARLVISDFVETNLLNIPISERTYIVIVTRHKDDVTTLKFALKTKAGYVGMIGSRRRVLQAYQLLLKAGITEKQLEKVNAPIGLDIGAETPEEIAVSIMAEITERRRMGHEKPAEPKKVKVSSIKSIAAADDVQKETRRTF